MSKRNTKYLLITMLLIGGNLYLFFRDAKSMATSFDDTLFTVSDTTKLQSIEIQNKHGLIHLHKHEGKWRLNEDIEVDKTLKDVLFSLLNQVKVKRKVGMIEGETEGTITLTYVDGNLHYTFMSDPLDTKSFFIKDGVSYQVEVPGYRDHVINIFELDEDQWRSRLVFDGNWRTIQSLELESHKNRLQIVFKDQFYLVNGNPTSDSTALIDYLNQFQYLKANEMISYGKFPELDSLTLTDPLAKLTITDIKTPKPIILKIYPHIRNQQYHLVINEANQMMVFSTPRIRQLLKFDHNFTEKK